MWSTASRVLVEACGHPDSSASSIAADGIRRVARAALDKADATGAGAAAGEAAARPFLDAFVLAEDADTRARLVEGLGACLTSRPRGFGPAWRTAVDVFARAVVDPDPNVALAAADAALAALVVGVRDACESSGTRTESSGTGSASSSSASSSSAPASLAIEMVRLAADFALVADGRASRAAAAALREMAVDAGAKSAGAAAIRAPAGVPSDGSAPLLSPGRHLLRWARRSRRTCGARRSARSPPSPPGTDPRRRPRRLPRPRVPTRLDGPRRAPTGVRRPRARTRVRVRTRARTFLCARLARTRWTRYSARWRVSPRVYPRLCGTTPRESP